jgi:hypothetical protein
VAAAAAGVARVAVAALADGHGKAAPLMAEVAAEAAVAAVALEGPAGTMATGRSDPVVQRERRAPSLAAGATLMIGMALVMMTKERKRTKIKQGSCEGLQKLSLSKDHRLARKRRKSPFRRCPKRLGSGHGEST